MTWFNTYDSDGEGFTRRVVIEVDLKTLPLSDWTLEELGFRLAVIYPQVDGYDHLTASDEVKAEVVALRDEIERRGYDWTSNLKYNENMKGFGWQPYFDLRENTA